MFNNNNKYDIIHKVFRVDKNRKVIKKKMNSEIIEILNSDKINEQKLFGIIPEMKILKTSPVNHPAHKFDILTHTLESVNLTKNKTLKLALLLHDIGKPESMTYDEKGITRFWGHNEKSVEISKPILERLEVDPEESRLILQLIEYHDKKIESVEEMKDMKKRLGSKSLGLLIEMQEADLLTHADWYRDKKVPLLNKVKDMYKNIIKEEELVK